MIQEITEALILKECINIYLEDRDIVLPECKVISVDKERGLCTVMYEDWNDYDISKWQETFKIESIGSIAKCLSYISKTNNEILTTDDSC